MKFILLTLLSFLLIACNQEAQTKSTVATDKPPHNHFIGKPQAGISMQYEFLNSKEMNEELEIKLLFKVSRDTETLYVDLNLSPGLKSLDSQSEYQFNKISKGASEEIIIRVIPETSGEQVIYVSASIDVKGVKQSRAFIIPVTTGSTEQFKSNQNTPAKGTRYIPSQNVISMPATQTDE